MARAGVAYGRYTVDEDEQVQLVLHGDSGAEDGDDVEPIYWVGCSSQQPGTAAQASTADQCQQPEQLLPLPATSEQDIPMLPLGQAGPAGQQLQRLIDVAVDQPQQQPAVVGQQQQLPPPPLYAGLGSHIDEHLQAQASDGCMEPPPPYTASQPKFIRCKVCRKLIDIDNKQHLLVVKCDSCRELTPLREPPAGKRYLRCSCNCLMMVDASAARLICARPSCQRSISIHNQGGVRVAASRVRGTVTARCGHCSRPFQCNSSSKKLVRCPHCRKVSVMDHRYKMRMASIFALAGVILLVAAVAACGVAIDNDNGSWGMFSFLGASVLISLFFLQRTFYYCRLQVSHPCQPSTAGVVP